MATLVRAPEELDIRVRESAKRHAIPLNTWWLQAAEEKLQSEKLNIPELAARINSDPIMREVLDRLGQ